MQKLETVSSSDLARIEVKDGFLRRKKRRMSMLEGEGFDVGRKARVGYANSNIFISEKGLQGKEVELIKRPVGKKVGAHFIGIPKYDHIELHLHEGVEVTIKTPHMTVTFSKWE